MRVRRNSLFILDPLTKYFLKKGNITQETHEICLTIRGTEAELKEVQERISGVLYGPVQ